MLSPAFSVVIDTNVWISGLISRTGAPAELTRRVVRNSCPIFTQATFDELRDRFWHPRFDRYVSIEQRNALLDDIVGVAQQVTVPQAIGERRLCRDPADDKFIHAALVVQPSWLVTGDKDLLVLADTLRAEGVEVLSPADALALLAFQIPAGLTP